MNTCSYLDTTISQFPCQYSADTNTANCILSHSVSNMHVIARSEATRQSQCRQYEFAEMIRHFVAVAARLPRQCAHWLAMTVEIDSFRNNSAPQHWSRGPKDVSCSTQHVTNCQRALPAELHTPSKGSDRSRGPEDVSCSTQIVTNCPRRLAAKRQFVNHFGC